MLSVGYASAGVLGLWGTALGLLIGPPIVTLIRHRSEIVEAFKEEQRKEKDERKDT